MSDIEHVRQKSLIEKIKDVEQVGILHVKGYSMREISTLMSLNINDIKSYIEEYKMILNQTIQEDPFFLEKVQKWINKYPEFKILNSKNINYDLIHHILRKIVKKTNSKWYELRTNSSKLKKFFLKYL